MVDSLADKEDGRTWGSGRIASLWQMLQGPSLEDKKEGEGVHNGGEEKEEEKGVGCGLAGIGYGVVIG